MADRKKHKHLGRGLQSLLGPITTSSGDPAQVPPVQLTSPNFISDKVLHECLREIDLSVISPNPYQPRTVWNQDDLVELSQSIRTNGVIQPIIVRPAGEKFELIAGERRFRAAKLADLKTIPALIRLASDEQLLELALIENIHRTNLNPIERAKAYHNYVNIFSLTQTEAAERLGENRSVIANHLRLLDLPDEIRQMLTDGSLSMGHARAILALPTDELRRKLANRAMVGRLSVREVERLVRRHLSTATTDSQSAISVRSKPTHIVDLERSLTSQLGTKVTINARKNGQRGKITIEFYSLDDFDRITEQIGLGLAEQV